MAPGLPSHVVRSAVPEGIGRPMVSKELEGIGGPGGWATIEPVMPVGFTDTDPVAERLQVALLRAAGTTRRLALALSLTDTVHDLARSAIARTLHVADQTEVRLRFVELHYGRDLAEAIRRRLTRQQE